MLNSPILRLKKVYNNLSLNFRQLTACFVQHFSSRFDLAFVNCGIHPPFSKRNFTAILTGAQTIEVVCRPNHPLTESTPWAEAIAMENISSESKWRAFSMNQLPIWPIPWPASIKYGQFPNQYLYVKRQCLMSGRNART